MVVPGFVPELVYCSGTVSVLFKSILSFMFIKTGSLRNGTDIGCLIHIGSMEDSMEDCARVLE